MPTPARPNETRPYKGFKPKMGVYVVRHRPSGRALVGWSRHLDGILNRHRFQLGAGMHPNPRLQADWAREGASSFDFEILDELQPHPDRPGDDPDGELAELEAMWRERLGLTPETSYG